MKQNSIPITDSISSAQRLDMKKDLLKKKLCQSLCSAYKLYGLYKEKK